MKNDTIGRPMEILLVEDSLTFARMAIHALKKGNVLHRLTWLTDGAEAWDFLQSRGKFESAPRPDLLLLDLNLPGMDGQTILSNLRADQSLCKTPVVVMTGDGDAMNHFDLVVEAFLLKPLDFNKFMTIVEQLSHLWKADMIVPVRMEDSDTADLPDTTDLEPF